jgi:hypothetical protein
LEALYDDSPVAVLSMTHHVQVGEAEGSSSKDEYHDCNVLPVLLNVNTYLG